MWEEKEENEYKNDDEKTTSRIKSRKWREKGVEGGEENEKK
jgi:hypothetical protein